MLPLRENNVDRANPELFYIDKTLDRNMAMPNCGGRVIVSSWREDFLDGK